MLKRKKRLRTFLGIGLVAASVWLPGMLMADSLNTYRIKGTDICVPQEHAVELPTPLPPETVFNDVSKAHNISISFKHNEVSQAIPGYKGIIEIKDSIRYQGLYLSLYPGSKDPMIEESPGDLTRIASAPDLFFLNYRSVPLLPMTVFEKHGQGYKEWGYCSIIPLGDNPKILGNGPEILECERADLTIDSFRVFYGVYETNLHLHKEIDQFIKDRLNHWRCD